MVATSKVKPSDICGRCAKPGHWKAECRSKASSKPKANSDVFAKDNTRGQEQLGRQGDTIANGPGHYRAANAAYTEGIAFVAEADAALTPVSQAVHTYLDSAASRHLISERKLFTSLKATHETIQWGGKDNCVGAEGCGTAVMEVVLPDGKTNKVTLSNALWVPTCRHNLISVGALKAAGGIPQFDAQGNMLIMKDGRIAIGIKEPGYMWLVKLTAQQGTPLPLRLMPKQSKSSALQTRTTQVGSYGHSDMAIHRINRLLKRLGW